MQLCSYAVMQLCRSETETLTESVRAVMQLCRSETETLTESVRAVVQFRPQYKPQNRRTAELQNKEMNFS